MQPEVVKGTGAIDTRVQLSEAIPEVIQQSFTGLADVGGDGRFELVSDNLYGQRVNIAPSRDRSESPRVSDLGRGAYSDYPGLFWSIRARDTIRLAGELVVKTVVSMSGTPGDGPGATMVDWVFYPWPADAVAIQARQWEIAIPSWQQMAAHATSNGVKRIAFELHPVFNVPTLVRMREAVGPVIGVNTDPSHLFWHARMAAGNGAPRAGCHPRADTGLRRKAPLLSARHAEAGARRHQSISNQRRR